MGTIKDERICKSLLRIIVCHYYLRCSYQLHGSVMATKSFLTFFEFARFFSKDLYRYIHNAMCGYVCFSSSRFFFTEEIGFIILHYKNNENIWIGKSFSNL